MRRCQFDTAELWDGPQSANREVAKMSSNQWRVLLLASTLICSACGKKDASDVKHSGTAGSTTAVSTSNGSTADVAALADSIAAAVASLPRREFDDAVLASQLGNDPQAEFAWVRDHTWWAPYRGLLRGPRGVMLDRLGSNLDRTLLLGDLLRRSGRTVRIAHAELPEALARRLIAKVSPMPDQRVGQAAATAALTQATARLMHVIPGLRDSVDREIRESRRAAEEATTLVQSEADRLAKIVGNSRAAGSAIEERAVLAAMKDHWWIELKDGSQWLAMDVLLPDSAPGTTLAAASKEFSWDTNAEYPALPEEDWHTVKIGVVVERISNGTLSVSTPLEVTLRPASVLDRQISLVHVPMPWPDKLPDPKADPNAVGNAAVNVRTWIPVLRVGSESSLQSAVSDGGDLVTNPLDPQKAVSGAAGGSLFSGLDTALAGGEMAPSYMTAEWIEYETHVPGERPTRVRRPIFDLLGPAKRKAPESGVDVTSNDQMVRRYEALLSRTDILLQPCALTEEFVTDLMASGVVTERNAIRRLAQNSDATARKDATKSVLMRMNPWGPLPDLALWRAALASRPADSFIGRPNILNYRMTRPVVNSDKTPIRELVDLATNDVAVRPASAKEAFDIRLSQGVADTVAEMTILGGNRGAVTNTASMFANSAANNVANFFIKPDDKKLFHNLNWPDYAAATLSEDLQGGYAAVVLAAPVTSNGKPRLGWWRVDPVSGATVGVIDDGYHAGAVEDAITRVRVAIQGYLDEDAGYWAQQSIRKASGEHVSAKVAEELAIRQAMIAYRAALRVAVGLPP
jgi:hypothetical protein